MVYGILEQLGAQIAVESKPRRCAAFTVTFRTGDDAAPLPPNDVVNLRKSPPNAPEKGVLWKILARAGELQAQNPGYPEIKD